MRTSPMFGATDQVASGRVSWPRATLAALFAAGLLAGAPARAQAVDDRPPSAFNSEINPKQAYPGQVKPDLIPGFHGPLSPYAERLAEAGLTFHALLLDFSAVNPSLGLQPGNGANTGFYIEGADLDLGKAAGLAGTSLHFENVFFAGVHDLEIAAQIGDSQIGYQPPPTPRIARLSRATVEQELLGRRLAIELGITHPNKYYALGNCSSINSCYQDLLYINGGFTTPFFSVPGGNVSYKLTPTTYVEGGAFAVSPGTNAFTGYDLGAEPFSGVLGLGEIGAKADFGEALYPYRYSLTGFANDADHVAYDARTAFTGRQRNVGGTAGIVAQGEQVVWRQDGGLDPENKAPTAVKIYGSLGQSLDSTVPIAFDGWVGANLMSPFAGRPEDRYGLKFNYERLNADYDRYISAAKAAAGGRSSPYDRSKYIFEADAHIQLPAGTAIEPVFQYAVNPNSYWNPVTPVKARDGFYFGGTYIVPIGTLLGVEASKT